jgi:hypothetical protein
LLVADDDFSVKFVEDVLAKLLWWKHDVAAMVVVGGVNLQPSKECVHQLFLSLEERSNLADVIIVKNVVLDGLGCIVIVVIGHKMLFFNKIIAKCSATHSFCDYKVKAKN